MTFGAGTVAASAKRFTDRRSVHRSSVDRVRCTHPLDQRCLGSNSLNWRLGPPVAATRPETLKVVMDADRPLLCRIWGGPSYRGQGARSCRRAPIAILWVMCIDSAASLRRRLWLDVALGCGTITPPGAASTNPQWDAPAMDDTTQQLVTAFATAVTVAGGLATLAATLITGISRSRARESAAFGWKWPKRCRRTPTPAPRLKHCT